MPRRCAILLVCLALVGADRKEAPAPSFQKEILPLFQAKCQRCHSGETPKADLDLTTPAAILKGGESGPAVVPGKPDESLLYEKVHGGTMPPAKKDRLSAAEIEMIRRWIAGETTPSRAAAVSQHDVIPILLRRCTVCHGRHRQEGGLDLRTRAALLR